MSVKPVKAAIVGCGRISGVYFENLTKRFRIIELKACTSRSMASAQKKALEYGLTACSYEEILADPEIELIINLTPAPEHAAIIRSALEAGKHVYTEKVITPDTELAEALIALAERKSLWLCSAPEHFMGSAWQCARELIDKGMIGQVTSVYASMAHHIGSFADTFDFVNEPAGGMGMDFGVYFMTAMTSLMGPVTEVSGMVRTMFPKRIRQNASHPDAGQVYRYSNEDMLMGCLAFENGALGTIHMNGNTIMPVPPAFMVHGTEGVISLPNPGLFSGDVKLYRPGATEPMNVIPAHGLHHDSRGVGTAEMGWAIRLGRKPRTEAHLGLHCLEVLNGLKISSETGERYLVKSTCERPAPLKPGFLNHPPASYDEEGVLM